MVIRVNTYQFAAGNALCLTGMHFIPTKMYFLTNNLTHYNTFLERIKEYVGNCYRSWTFYSPIKYIKVMISYL